MIDKNCPVPILQSWWEFEKLVKTYEALKPKKVIEIGSFYGATLWYWIKYAKLDQLISVDYPIGPSDGRHKEMIESRAKWEEWTKGIEFHNLIGDSHSREMQLMVQNIVPNNDIDFLFIDADHTYNGVKMDFEMYGGFVRKGGYIAFHDTVGIPDVKRLVSEIKHKYRHIEFCEPGGWGITILEKN